MPLKSKAQWRLWGHLLDTGEVTKQQFDEATHATPGGYDALPDRKAKPAKKTSRPKAKPPGPKSRRGTAGKVSKVGSARTTRGGRGRGRR